jgi:methionyl-tRNA formyltransferase
MQMDAGMDTGAVLHQLPTPIAPFDTSGSLTERLATLGAKALIESVGQLDRDGWKAVPQDDARATLAPKLDRESARLRWAAGSQQVSRRIRAFDPAPGAWTTFEGIEVKCFGPTVVAEPAEAGLVVGSEPMLIVGTGDASVAVAEVQPAGKRRMPATEWTRGRGAKPGQRLS